MMKKILMSGVLLFISLGLSAKEISDKIEGNWFGHIQLPSATMEIGLEIFTKADGSLGANMTSPQQGNRYMLVSSITFKNNQLELKLHGAPIRVVAVLQEAEQTISGQLVQGDSAFTIGLKKVPTLTETLKPQSDIKPTTYREVEVTYHNKVDNVWLAGTLSVPQEEELQRKKRYPAVILIAGSGANPRDVYHSGHRLFAVLADHLAKQGFVVLRSDKRGVYKSAGKYQEGELDAFARDTQAAVEFVRQHPSVNNNSIALIGHSEGSIVSAKTAQLTPVDAIVSLAGPGLATLDVLLEQDQAEPRAAGASDKEVAILLEFSKKFYQTVLDTKNAQDRHEKLAKLYQELSGEEAEVHRKWNNRSGTLSVSTASSDTFYNWLQNDPMKNWQGYDKPLLIINGDKDVQVKADTNVQGIKQANHENPSPVIVKVIPDVNHMLQTAKTGAIEEYGQIEETINQTVLVEIEHFVQNNL